MSLTRPTARLLVRYSGARRIDDDKKRGREVEILTASWRRVRRQSGETSARAWIGVSERPVQSTHRPHIRVRNVIRAR